MKQEHDFEGALESMPKEDVHERVIWRWFSKHYSEIRAALTAAKGDGWLPIESAPKDVKILVCQSRNNIIETALNVDDHGNWKTGTAPMNYIVGVTHWMPLPKPPQDGGDDA